jgi:hypothetical protein
MHGTGKSGCSAVFQIGYRILTFAILFQKVAPLPLSYRWKHMLFDDRFNEATEKVAGDDA